MDAVIVFSDILLPFTAAGMKLTFDDQTGPRFDSQIRSPSDISSLSVPNARISFAYLFDAISNLHHELGDETALLGFVGAPWTLAAYLIEGGSGSFESARTALRSSPEIVTSLLEKITAIVSSMAVEQARSGADAIQIFDTWGGLLSPSQYEEFALPHIKKIISDVKETGAATILYVRDSSRLLDSMILSGADVLSLGSDVDMMEASRQIGDRAAIQGNIDPEVLLRSPSTVERETQRLLERVGNRPGYIANLGRGVMPTTPLASVKAFVDTIKNAAH